MRTVHRACNLCEAICGLEIKVDGPKIVSIRGDERDPFSRGHICPKGVALQDIHDDPDRLRRPMRKVEGEWVAIDWDEAFELAAEKLASIQLQHGNDAVGFYAGNPTVHNIGTAISAPQLARVLQTRNAFSATSVDQLPQQLASLLMYGHQFLIPIPDIDRTDYFLILGGNPIVSNGSLMTAPDVARRLRDLRNRGGKIVVIDPRRTETANVADEHHFIRPATDAALLMALINVIVESGVPQNEKLRGLDDALAAIAHMTPEIAATITGIDGNTIRRIAREFASAKGAVCYGRVGANLQAYGTLNAWLIQLVNILTGNLDREGGALLTRPLIPITGRGTRPGHYAQWRSRVSGLPESGGELPVAALSEEILTPGEGQIRGLITICGNPVLSTPDGRKLATALDALEFMLAVDIYLNETTRYADLVLPPASSLEHDHYDLVFNALAIRDVARYNTAIWPRAEDARYDWEIFRELCIRLAAKLGREHTPIASTRDAIAKRLGRGTQNIDIDTLIAAEHGLDLGALKPSLYERLETEDGKIDCAPAVLLEDVKRFMAEHPSSAFGTFSPRGGEKVDHAFRLIGRRHLRSNNSWMHNSHRLTKGKRRDQLMMHPDDLASLDLVDGQLVDVRASAGSVRIAVQSTDSVMRGVVCLPHGFGHASYNDLANTRAIDAVSGNGALNGIAVEIAAAPAQE